MAQKPLSEELLREAVRLVEEHGRYAFRYATSTTGRPVSPHTLRSRLQEARLRLGLEPKQSFAPSDLRKESERESYETRIRQLQAELKRMRLQMQEDREIWETITGIAGYTPNPPMWVLEQRKPSAPGIPVGFLSDIHCGERVSLVETGGVNEYNIEIFERRFKLFFEKVIELAFQQETVPDYPGFVLLLGGDIISGDIHEELRDTNIEYTTQTVLRMIDALVWAIDLLKSKFGNVFLAGVVGNHGRTTLKPRYKGRVYSSWEYLLYRMLAKLYQSDRRVSVYFPAESDARLTINGWRFLLTHGDTLGVKGGDGIIGNIGPIMRGAIKIGRAEAQMGRDFDVILMGHWHDFISMVRGTYGIIVNGSMKGYDEFAKNALRSQPQLPIQTMFFVHRNYGITKVWPIFLEKPFRKPVSQAAVTWGEVKET